MKKLKKITFRDSLIIINQKCDVNNVLYYIKTNMIRAPLEVAITLFLMESMIIFTKFFINDLLMAQEMILIIFQPLLAGALICFFYLMGITYYTIKKIAMVAQNMTINKSAIKNYKTIDDCFIRFFKCIHIIGASLYTLPAIGQALYFSFLITSNNLQSWERLVFVISAVGISGGILWNILGFYSDSRLDWSKIYVDLKEFNIKSNKDLLNRKYHNFMWHALLNIIVFTLAILVAVGVVLNLHGSIIHPQDPNDINLGSISSYTFFIFLFISVITAYAKQMFMLYFVNKDQRIGVFFNIKELAQ